MQNTQKSADDLQEMAPAAKERLDSWKEIASYFGRQVRTVQLWEKSEGLPVRRQRHKKLGSVYAYRRDLDAWWIARSEFKGEDLSATQDERDPQSETEIIRTPSQPASSGGLRILALPFEAIHSSFDRLAGHTAIEQYANGLKSDLVLELTRSQFHPVVLPLNAIPTQAASPLEWAKEIASELEVDVMLSGSIRHLDGRLRISMQMVRASDLQCLWSDRFDANLDNSFEAQAELAQRISQALPDCETNCRKNRETAAKANGGLAQQACSMGFHSWQQRGADALKKAVNYFSDAIELDPNYAEAYAGLADSYISLSYSHLVAPRQAGQRAWDAIQRALKLNKHSIKVNNAYINALIHCSWNLTAAEKHCRKVIATGKADARTIQLYSSIMSLKSRHEEAIDLALRARKLAPERNLANLDSQVSLAYFYSGDYERAAAAARRNVELRPQHMMGFVLLGRIQAQQENWYEALESFEKSLELSRGSALNQALVAYAYAGCGEVSRAQHLLRDLETKRHDHRFAAYEVSGAYATLGMERESLEHLHRAVNNREMMTLYVTHDPRFSKLRTSSNFKRLASSVYPNRELPMAV